MLGCVLNKLSCLTYRHDIVELFQKKVKIVITVKVMTKIKVTPFYLGHDVV